MSVSVNVETKALSSPTQISEDEIISIGDQMMDACEQECSHRGFKTPLCLHCQAAALIFTLHKELKVLRRLQALEVKQ